MLSTLDATTLRLRVKITEVANSIVFSGPSDQREVIVADKTRHEDIVVQLTSPKLRYTISGKDQNDTVVEQQQITADARVDIEDIWVDNILIEKWAMSPMCSFRPDYTEQHRSYASQHNLTLKEVFTNEWSFYFNGCLEFDLTDFFIKYNQVLTSGLEHYNHWVKESHLGHINPAKLHELKQLLQTL
jgi:hypothetical protein